MIPALRLALCLTWLALFSLPVRAGISWTNYAGLPGGPGNADGTGVAARFANPGGIVRDASGNLYVADSANHTIRKIDPMGVVTTFAGSAGQAGMVDGVGSAARFTSPQGLAIDAAGNLYVSDLAQRIVRIAPDGTAVTIAGTPGTAGSADGMPGSFNSPTGLAIDSAGDLFVADTGNQTIREITPDGTVSTLAGSGAAGFMDGIGTAAVFHSPTGVAVDAAGNVYVADQGNQVIRLIAPDGTVSTYAGSQGVKGTMDGTGTAAQFNLPTGVALDASGDLFVADQGNDTIRAITPAMVVSTLAGLAGTPGRLDGTGSVARFLSPTALVVDSSGNVFVSDSGNNTIREVTSAGVVTTLAGTPANPGSVDGVLENARFNMPKAIAVDTAGNVYVADTANNVIRMIGTGNSVTTIAGSGVAGHADATGTAATFNAPQGLTVDGGGNIFVADTGNHTIRKIAANTNLVTTVAGVAGSTGSRDGSASSTTTPPLFNSPTGIDLNTGGSLIVADTGNDTIRSVTTTGVVTTIAGTAGKEEDVNGAGTAAHFLRPTGIAVASNGVIYVTEADPVIRKITLNGMVSTFAGTATQSGDADGVGAAASFEGPSALALDARGNLLVTDSKSGTVRKITPAGVVTTLGGTPGVIGGVDLKGTSGLVGPAAEFSAPSGIAVTTTGTIYVADTGNNQIQVGTGQNLSSDHTLSGLTVSAGTLSPAFSPATAAYTLSVPETVTSTTVTPVLNSPAAEETVNGVPLVPGATSASIPLKVGANAISVLVTAEDNTQQTYTVSITVIDTDPPVFTFVPSDVTAVADSPTGGTVFYLSATAKDNSDVAPTITYSNNSGTVFPVGTTTVTVTAGDSSGNSTTSQFHVTVVTWRQSLPAASGTIVTGAGATGTGIPAGAKWRTFGTPGLDSSPLGLADGAPVFRATFDHSGMGVLNGVFGLGGKSPLIAKTGDLAPGTSTQADATMQTIANTAQFATLQDPMGNGGTAFIGTLKLKATLATAANDQGIWSNAFPDSATTLSLVARKGSTAALATGQSADNALYHSFTAAALNDGGHLFWVSKLSGVAAASSQALFVQSAAAGPAQRLLQTGQTVTVGAATPAVKSFLALNAPSALASGLTGYGAGQANGGALVPVVLTLTGAGSPKAIGTVGPNQALTLQAVTGTAVPAGTGVGAGNWKTLGAPAMGATGALAFRADVAVGTTKTTGVFLQPPGGALTAIAQFGNPAPGFTGRTYGALGDPLLNTLGDLMFFAQIPAVSTAAQSEALYWLPVGGTDPQRVEFTGDTAPDASGVAMAGVEFSRFTGAALPCSTATSTLAGPVFTAVLKNAPGMTSVKPGNNAGLWALDHAGTVRLLVRTGSTVNGKILRSIGAFRFASSSPLQARTTGAADAVIYLATFTDHSTAVVKAAIP
jgi:hypothetical protein